MDSPVAVLLSRASLSLLILGLTRTTQVEQKHLLVYSVSPHLLSPHFDDSVHYSCPLCARCARVWTHAHTPHSYDPCLDPEVCAHKKALPVDCGRSRAIGSCGNEGG